MNTEYNRYMTKYQTSRYFSRKEKFIESMGGECVQCGSKDNLQFDHINPESKSFEIAKRMHGAPLEILEEEIKKCQLLCKDCHDRKHQTGKYTHGTLSSYAYCKCDVCKKAKSDHNRAYREEMGATVDAKEIECCICGVKFETKHHMQNTCSNTECKKERKYRTRLARIEKWGH